MSESQPTPVVRDSQGLRDALFDEIDALRAGSSNPQRASAMAKLSIQVINSVMMELSYHKYVQSVAEKGLEEKEVKTLPPLTLSLGDKK